MPIRLREVVFYQGTGSRIELVGKKRTGLLSSDGLAGGSEIGIKEGWIIESFAHPCPCNIAHVDAIHVLQEFCAVPSTHDGSIGMIQSPFSSNHGEKVFFLKKSKALPPEWRR